MNISEMFCNASLEELKSGYTQDEEHYICLLCGKQIEKEIIYPEDGIFYEAGRYIRVHIESAHQSVFEHLINLNKKMTGLSDHQSNLLQLFYQRRSDKEVQQELGIGSASTIRNHRSMLKEKERQVKVFLVMMELLKEKEKHAPAFVSVHKTATMMDDSFNVTQIESETKLGRSQ